MATATETVVKEYTEGDPLSRAKREVQGFSAEMGGDGLQVKTIGSGISPIIDERGNVVGVRPVRITRA